MNIGVHVSFGIMVFSRYMHRSGIAGSYGNGGVTNNWHDWEAKQQQHGAL